MFALRLKRELKVYSVQHDFKLGMRARVEELSSAGKCDYHQWFRRIAEAKHESPRSVT